MILTFDIETVPGQAPGLRDEIAATIKPPAVLKSEKSIAEWHAESKAQAIEDAWQKTALDGGLGQIVCIGYAVDDEPVQTIVVDDLSPEGEEDALLEFRSVLHGLYRGTSGSRPVIVGHNVIGFDLPFLWRRCVIRGVQWPFWLPRNPKPWSDQVADTMVMWAGDRDRISLDKLCRLLGLPGKSGSGLDVWPMAQAGKWADIARYCAVDVERTRDCYRRMQFLPVTQAKQAEELPF